MRDYREITTHLHLPKRIEPLVDPVQVQLARERTKLPDAAPDGRADDFVDPLVHAFHHVFWLGDLNFRVLIPRAKVLSRLAAIEALDGPVKNYEELYSDDELARARAKRMPDAFITYSYITFVAFAYRVFLRYIRPFYSKSYSLLLLCHS